MCATIGSSSMISIFFIGEGVLSRGKEFGVFVQEQFDPDKFVIDRLHDRLGRNGVTLQRELFELTEQWDQRHHPAGGTGACATVRDTCYTWEDAFFQSQANLAELIGRLFEIKLDQFGEVLGGAARKIEQPLNIHGGRSGGCLGSRKRMENRSFSTSRRD